MSQMIEAKMRVDNTPMPAPAPAPKAKPASKKAEKEG
jgi:hypothetical protein